MLRLIDRVVEKYLNMRNLTSVKKVWGDYPRKWYHR